MKLPAKYDDSDEDDAYYVYEDKHWGFAQSKDMLPSLTSAQPPQNAAQVTAPGKHQLESDEEESATWLFMSSPLKSKAKSKKKKANHNAETLDAETDDAALPVDSAYADMQDELKGCYQPSFSQSAASVSGALPYTANAAAIKFDPKPTGSLVVELSKIVYDAGKKNPTVWDAYKAVFRRLNAHVTRPDNDLNEQALIEQLNSHLATFRAQEPKTWTGERPFLDELVPWSGSAGSAVCVVMHYPTFHKATPDFWDPSNSCIARLMDKGLGNVLGFDLHHRQHNASRLRATGHQCPGRLYKATEPEVGSLHDQLSFDYLQTSPAPIVLLFGDCAYKTFKRLAGASGSVAEFRLPVTSDGRHAIQCLLAWDQIVGGEASGSRLVIQCPHPEAIFIHDADAGASLALRSDSACNMAMLLGGLPQPQALNYFCRFQQRWADERHDRGKPNVFNHKRDMLAISSYERETKSIMPAEAIREGVLDYWTGLYNDDCDFDYCTRNGFSLAEEGLSAQDAKGARTKNKKNNWVPPTTRPLQPLKQAIGQWKKTGELILRSRHHNTIVPVRAQGKQRGGASYARIVLVYPSNTGNPDQCEKVEMHVRGCAAAFDRARIFFEQDRVELVSVPGQGQPGIKIFSKQYAHLEVTDAGYFFARKARQEHRERTQA